MTSVSDKGNTFISFSQPDRIYFFFILRVDKPFTFPKRASPTDPNAEALAQSVADHPVSESMVFGELWQRRLRGDLIYLEDGVMEHWHAGRIVLAGDAVHKVFSTPIFDSQYSVTSDYFPNYPKQVTPNMGFGGNCGIEDIAVVCNHLNRLLVNCKGRKPSLAELDRTFETYQTERMPRMKEVADLCRLVTKVQAWHTPWHKFIDTWVFPLQSDTTIANQVSEIIRTGAKLDYVDNAGCFSGSMAWKDEEAAKDPLRTSVSSHTARLLGAAAALMVLLQGVRFFTLVSASAPV
jgi:hypothetical protein